MLLIICLYFQSSYLNVMKCTVLINAAHFQCISALYLHFLLLIKNEIDPISNMVHPKTLKWYVRPSQHC